MEKVKDSDDDEDYRDNDVNVSEGQVLKVNEMTVKEQFTKAPAHYTEATLLSAMEKAGASEMDDDVERKGLGTPATRADIIEKLVNDGFVRREKKQMIPTEDGMKLITILPEQVKSPKLTADWENELVLVAKGERSIDDFMKGIKKMVRVIRKRHLLRNALKIKRRNPRRLLRNHLKRLLIKARRKNSHYKILE